MTDIPCIPFPDAKTIKIPLPFKAELRSIVDISNGPPTDCALAHSLMLQITPMLAGMACMLKILKVIKALQDSLDATPPIVGGISGIADAIADVASCFLLLDPTEIAKMIAGILDMIIAYLSCLIDAFDSIWKFQVGIDLNAAQGNPVLLASLDCARTNAESSLASLGEALQGIQPLLDLVGMVMGIVNLEPLDLPPLAASTPSLEGLADGQDPLEPVKKFRDALKQARAALPV